jgi:nucleotidyltransferase/DNA polymerase involved in DNA repair
MDLLRLVTGGSSGIPRAIVHLHLDAFFAAVEVLENPDLACSLAAGRRSVAS